LAGVGINIRRRVAWPSRLTREHRESLAAFLFLAPDTIGLVVFVGLPMLLALSMGFFRVSGFGDYQFIGLDNYRRIFADEYFLNSVRVTTTYTVILVPVLYAVSLGLALLVQKLPHSALLRTLFFLPHVVSVIVVATIWRFMLTSKVGVINKLFFSIGIEGYSWLGNPAYALGAIVFVSLWFEAGFFMIILLAGLQDIPRDYYEAAKLDGAGYWQMFRWITLPLLRPTSFFVCLISLVGAIAGGQGIDLIIAMTKGGPARSTSLATYYVYQQAFEVGDYGYAAAVASFLVVAMLPLTGLLFVLSRGGRFEAR
jgi:multiple sugar transport system permease protein